MLNTIEKLRIRILEYRKKRIDNQPFNDFKLICCTSVELSVIYAELYYKIDRKVGKGEMVFFGGQRFIDDVIGSDDEFSDIFDMYYELSEAIKKEHS